jgi:very-short-patch-repair endonuclease
VQTLLFADQLERKLSGIRDGARTALSEMGVNILYAAFGYLEWYESDASDLKLFAPLLLHPLAMERRLVRQTYRYSIGSTGDDSEINLTLKERLLRDFGLVLPEFGEEDTPEQYLAKVEEAIREMKRWRVRRFVTAGLFPFSRLVMYHDLDPERWPEQKALYRHPVLVELLGGSDRSEALYAVDYEVDRPEIEAKVPLLITDADASQFSAIVDVMDGKHLVIKGPPGTGKSQTITNIIAAALAKGLKVLFVAEKMAALEVVKKRLDEAGLGDFCLELHSTKANKKDVLESLRKRLELHPPAEIATLQRTIEEYERHRHQLTRYVELINQPFGSSGSSLQQLFWATLRTRARARELQVPAGLDEVMLQDALDLTAIDLDRRRVALDALEQHSTSFNERYGGPNHHPWAGMRRTDLSPFEKEALLRALAGWHAAMLELDREAEQTATDLSIPEMTTIDEIVSLIKAIALLPEPPNDFIANLLPKLRVEEALTALDRFMDRLRSCQEALRTLRAKVEDPIGSLPQADRVRELVAQHRKLTVASGIFIGRVGELPALAERYRELARLTEARITAAKRLLEPIGMGTMLSASVLSAMLEAIEVLRLTPRERLRRRSAPLLDEAVRSVLERAKKEARAITEHHQQLVRAFIFSPDDSPQEFRGYAAALRRAGLFNHFFMKTIILSWLAAGEFRQACAVWRRTRKVYSTATAEKMARDFDQLAEHLEAVQKFRANDRLQAICGREFHSLSTDFDEMLAVNAFACEVARKFPGAEPSHQEARRFLLEGALDTLDAVLAEADAHTIMEVGAFVSDLSNNVLEINRDIDLDTVPSPYLKLAENTESLYHALKAMGIKEECTTRSLSELADEVEDFAKLKEAIEGHEPIKDLLGAHFRGVDTDWISLAGTLQFVLDLRAAKLPEPLLAWFLQEGFPQQCGRLKDRVESLGAALKREAEARAQALHMSDLDSQRFFESDSLAETPLTATTARIGRALAARDELPAWIAYQQQRAEVEEMGLSPILEACEAANAPLLHLVAAFEHVFLGTVLHQAYKRYPELQGLSGTSQETARRHFQALDPRIIDLKRQQLTRTLARSPITSGRNWGPRREWTDLHLIRYQLTLQRRHIPVRDLLLKAGAAIQQMKPCWMMSPTSLAQFVRPGGADFDLVVIDEASQMRPEEALGAVGRSNQLVVVGDPQQLPPTSFFERIEFPDEDEMQAEDYTDTESILDLALAVFHPARELRWHYRSRHEGLIAFSNEHFYDGTLVVFPSPLAQHRDYGVEYRAVEGIYTPRAGINLPEAQAVAEAAVQFMATYPNRSLGLVTINQAQREYLTDEMDRLFARNPHADDYQKQWQDTLEPFFVKNLENVQGDERDVIFISTVYGPEQHGGRVAQRFGPINASAGHRRLNVLFTRAKEKVVVFSSMQASDVIPTAMSRPGVGILKHYLEYALSGRIDSGMATGREPDSDFEVFVAERLRREGVEVVPQVGVAGYFIDLAVKDPADPQRYLLGIECDGASYHSAKSARDRDRLRQEILEQKGWQLYRIWSTDWFNDPEHEAKKLLRHLHALTGSQWPG